MRKYLGTLIFVISLITLMFSCVKPIVKYDGVLEFSEDTLMFDTVFTTQGSSLRTLKVFNNTDDQLVISSISVSNGQLSQYNINVNGVSGYIFEDIEIEPHDSMYIFAQVRIDPNNINTPLIVEDSICFRMEKSEQYVKLLAWGQDANYIIADTYREGLPPYKIIADSNQVTIWNSQKPYVVFGYALIDSYGQLIVEAGTRVHFHSNGGIWVYQDGSIKVLGTPDNKVVFEGDRLEPYYDSIPGQWEKIWINEGDVVNEFHNTVIKNGLVGIHVQTLGEPKENALVLNNVEIHSMSKYGIYSMNYVIVAGNTVVSRCKEQLLLLAMGGAYDFRNCTFANYYKGSREASSLYVSNYYLDLTNQIYAIGALDAYFGNCIIYGNKDNEINTGVDADGQFNLTIENSLVRVGDKEYEYLEKYLSNCVRNQTPLFVDSLMLDYRLDTITSPAINAGSVSIVNDSPVLDITRDFSGNSRINDDAPDIGAFEFIDK